MLLLGLFGILFVAAFYAAWPLVFVMLAPLTVAAARGKTPAWLLVAVCCVIWAAAHSFFRVFHSELWLLLGLLHGGAHGLGMVWLRWVYQRTGWSLALLLPLVWTVVEWIRLLPPLGVPSGVLALALHEQLFMIQIADLGGIHLVTAWICLTNGAAAELWLSRGKARATWAVTGACWAFVLGYGAWRLHQSQHTLKNGPRIALVQPDVPGGEDSIGLGYDPAVYFQEMLVLTNRAAVSKPDLILWPEAPTPLPSLPFEASGLAPDGKTYLAPLEQLISKSSAPLIAGFITSEPGSRAPDRLRLANTAILVQKGAPVVRKQVKVRLFPFAETLPLPEGALRQTVSRWLGRAQPWLEPDDSRHIFTLPALGPHRTAINLCSELGFSESSGIFTPGTPDGGKPLELLLTLANEGDFQRNRALKFHASLAPFRAIEGRLAIARCGNTGLSFFVKPTGEVYGPVVNEKGQSWTGLGAPELPLIMDLVHLRRTSEATRAADPGYVRQVQAEAQKITSLRKAAGVSGVSVQRVYLDSRTTLFSRLGPWLGPLGGLGLVAVSFYSALRKRQGQGAA